MMFLRAVVIVRPRRLSFSPVDCKAAVNHVSRVWLSVALNAATFARHQGAGNKTTIPGKFLCGESSLPCRLTVSSGRTLRLSTPRSNCIPPFKSGRLPWSMTARMISPSGCCTKELCLKGCMEQALFFATVPSRLCCRSNILQFSCSESKSKPRQELTFFALLCVLQKLLAQKSSLTNQLLCGANRIRSCTVPPVGADFPGDFHVLCCPCYACTQWV